MVLIKLSFIFILAAAAIALAPLQVIALPVKSSPSSEHGAPKGSTSIPMTNMPVKSGSQDHPHPTRSNSGSSATVPHSSSHAQQQPPPGHQHPASSSSGSSSQAGSAKGPHPSPHTQQPPPTPQPQVDVHPVVSLYANSAFESSSTGLLGSTINRHPDHVVKAYDCIVNCLGSIGVGFPKD